MSHRPPMSRRLALFSPSLRFALAPHAEQLSRTLLRTSQSPTPLTRRNHRAALAASGKPGNGWSGI
jgi:hypothetical protein